MPTWGDGEGLPHCLQNGSLRFSFFLFLFFDSKESRARLSGNVKRNQS